MKTQKAVVAAILLIIAVFTGACVPSEQNTAQTWNFYETLDENSTQPWTDAGFADSDESFQFAIVADRSGGCRNGVFADGVKKLNLLQPEFVMSVGDLIAGNYNWAGQIEQQWNEFDKIIDNLEMKFFYLPGNHDLGGPSTMIQIWNQRYGRTYYHFVYKNVLFLCVNSDDPPYAQISDEQIEYFQNILKQSSDVRWTFVLSHRPWWTTLDDPDQWYVKSREAWIKFESLLPNEKCTVITGHDHRYDKVTRNGRKHFTLATTGGGFVEEGQKDHIMWITMGAKEPTIANLTLEGISDENFRKPQPQAKSEQPQTDTGIKIIPVDWMGRVFPDQIPESNESLSPIHVPRGGQASFQFALTTDADTKCVIQTGPIVTEQNDFIAGDKNIYHLQDVHVEGNHSQSYGSPNQHPGFFIRSAPFNVAEIRVEADELALQKGRTEAVLLNIKVFRFES